MIRLTLVWTGCLFLFPLLMLQGVLVRKSIKRLPDGLPPATGVVGEAGRSLQIVGIGDSVIAGVGVEHLSQSLTAKVAEQLAMELECSVQWAAMLDIMLKHSADVVPGVYWVSSSIEGAQVASDGYHPGEVACEMVAVDIVEKCLTKELIVAHET